MIQFIRDLLSPDASSEKGRIDSKGRISIPAWVRRNFLLLEGSEVELRFNLKRNLILIVFVDNGQNDVEVSKKKCGFFRMDSDSSPENSKGLGI